MTRSTSYGTCVLCGKRTTKAGIARHLASCLEAQQPSGGRTGRLLRLRIEDAYSPLYWMDVEIKGVTTLATLDAFLRARWLECCGHLSSFYIGNTEYTVPIEMMDMDLGSDARDMDVGIGKVLSKGAKFTHIYDFGTSTELNLRVTDERQGNIDSEPLRLLSHNEAPAWTCEVCGGDAEWVCTTCMWDQDNPFYCADHATDHDCEDEDPEMLLPVVNSPRMGQCAYGAV